VKNIGSLSRTIKFMKDRKAESFLKIRVSMLHGVLLMRLPRMKKKNLRRFRDMMMIKWS
jgi:hypothetical protein